MIRCLKIPSLLGKYVSFVFISKDDILKLQEILNEVPVRSPWKHGSIPRVEMRENNARILLLSYRTISSTTKPLTGQSFLLYIFYQNKYILMLMLLITYISIMLLKHKFILPGAYFKQNMNFPYANPSEILKYINRIKNLLSVIYKPLNVIFNRDLVNTSNYLFLFNFENWINKI